jgi:glycerol-1-phosphate dehydrogenase [NAD(P)+]
MANAVNGEEINQKAFSMMEEALDSCVGAYDQLTTYSPDAVAKLMNALVVAGLSMAECGNSRPASGSEHHISHYLEMDFVRRGERIPLHGLKVAIGTLISIEIYQYIAANKLQFKGAERVYELANALPTAKYMQDLLVKMGCPVRFSQIGVRKEVMEAAIEKAYTVRDRYTVLTLAHELGITDKIKPILMEKYY